MRGMRARNLICKQYPGSTLARVSLGKAYAEVFSVLSHDIHGHPLNGGSVRVAWDGSEESLRWQTCHGQEAPAYRSFVA